MESAQEPYFILPYQQSDFDDIRLAMTILTRLLTNTKAGYN